jgi:hypothetical protein
MPAIQFIRASSFEMAYSMQKHAPEVVDISKEDEKAKRLYGIDQPRTQDFGINVLRGAWSARCAVHPALPAAANEKTDAHTDIVAITRFHKQH